MAAAKRALAQTKDGGIAFAASTKKGGDALITMVNFDIWGNESCAEAGSCESAKASSCDDKDPCTVDRCTAKSGCKHTAHAEGALCGLNSYCVAGKCTKAPQDMAFVPKGKFWMGCNEKLNKGCFTNELPQHEVELSSYWIDRYEVPFEKYKACAAAAHAGASRAGADEARQTMRRVGDNLRRPFCWRRCRPSTRTAWSARAGASCGAYDRSRVFGDRAMCLRGSPRWPGRRRRLPCSDAP